MMINRMPYKVQPMNHVHTSKQGGELWLGDYYAATNIPLLRQKGIKSVLTAAAMLGVVYPKDQQMNHKVISAYDLPSYKMTPHFEEAFQFIDQALKRGNLLVHCAAGISRSTTLVIVYLLRAENMTFKQAIDYVRSKRSIICPNEGFQKELKRYEITVKKIILPKIQKEKQQSKLYQSSNLQEKEMIIDFLKDDKIQDKKKQAKMSATVNGNQANHNFLVSNNKDNKGFMRGKSLNYSLKPNNPISTVKDNKVQSKLPKENYIEQQKQISKLTKQFLTFKLQNPKIVTIKK